MPTYAYRCEKCAEEFDIVQSFSEKSLTTHEGCGGSLRKLFHPTGVVFKGSGFYVTDSRAARSGGSSEGGSSSNGSSKGSSGETKSTPGDAKGAKSGDKASGSKGPSSNAKDSSSTSSSGDR